MHRFTVTTTLDIEADTAEEAALLMFQTLTRHPAPTVYSVTDETGAVTEIELEREAANEFALIDQTADPGNW
ncbi:hypothetical protein [Pararhizobium sp.]|uniref:hypothetical protein n=1 Tax=Pararhizobium sp. TaxID=1977563 RepID=UPI002715CC9E|nr:hypothetical protein [Pararhizobium sp.]MDO9415172.1 hypothetical protein [Pararhizobium sp.]